MKGWNKLKKAAVISAVTVLGIGGIGALSGPQPNTASQNSQQKPSSHIQTAPKVQSATTQTQNPVQTAPVQQPASQKTSSATSPVYTPPAQPINCPNGTYVNSDGVTVCSPYSAPAAPAGATAQCADGSYSFSLHHSGTCSHHGGVATWL